MIEKKDIKKKLEDYLGRECKSNELINAEKDVGIIMSILLEKIEELDQRVKKLEK